MESTRIASDGGATTHGEVASIDPRRLSATVIIPTTEPPRYALEVSDLAGGRRLLSDEVSLLEHVGYVLGRRWTPFGWNANGSLDASGRKR